MASIKKTVNTLNEIYAPLTERAVRLVSTLKRLDADVDWGYFPGHTVDIKGETVLEEFPIPVVTLRDVCDIGIDIETVFIEGKLYKEQALEFDFDRLSPYRFSVYGAKNYLEDLFTNESFKELDCKTAIAKADEEEICISIVFMGIPRVAEIIETCSFMREIGTHILVRTETGVVEDGGFDTDDEGEG